MSKHVGEKCGKLCIHAICPGKFDPLKSVPAGRHFSRKIYFVPDSLLPVKCTPFSGFRDGQTAIKTNYTGGYYCMIKLTPVQRRGEVFRQSVATTKGIAISKQLFLKFDHPSPVINYNQSYISYRRTETTVGVFLPKCHSIVIQSYLSLKCIKEVTHSNPVRFLMSNTLTYR